MGSSQRLKDKAVGGRASYPAITFVVPLTASAPSPDDKTSLPILKGTVCSPLEKHLGKTKQEKKKAGWVEKVTSGFQTTLTALLF